MKNSKIKYQYAYDNNKEIIDISDVVKEMHEQFICISCGNILIPKIGADLRQRHFAHKNENISCNKETYMHLLAKNMFYNEYNNCIENKTPFYCDFKVEINCKNVFNAGEITNDIVFKLSKGEIKIDKFEYAY